MTWLTEVFALLQAHRRRFFVLKWGATLVVRKGEDKLEQDKSSAYWQKLTNESDFVHPETQLEKMRWQIKYSLLWWARIMCRQNWWLNWQTQQHLDGVLIEWWMIDATVGYGRIWGASWACMQSRTHIWKLVMRRRLRLDGQMVLSECPSNVGPTEIRETFGTL